MESRTSRGVTRVREARNVVLAMGYYELPNMLNVPAKICRTSRTSTRKRIPYYRQRVVIVGGKNSAAEAALEIHRAGGHVTMVHRGAGFRRFGEVPGQARHREPRQGRIDRRRTSMRRSSRSARNEVVLDTGATIPAEAVLLLTGYRADPEFMRRIGVEIHDETLAPKYHVDTYETSVPGLFVAGGQVAGSAPARCSSRTAAFTASRSPRSIAGRSR